uniref:Uncharacterized protein n=1 Tax=Peromyscus maniculatus bairdii TaxID=230844 RepID=A0A8C8UBM4_PERMB
MEPTFWSVHVKQAWDSAPMAPETEPPLLPVFSEELGPWPLPFYPVLGGIHSDRGEDLEQPLPRLQGDFPLLKRVQVLDAGQVLKTPSSALPGPRAPSRSNARKRTGPSARIRPSA